MSEQRTQEWLKFITPLLVGLMGSLIGGAVSWGITQQKMTDFERRVSSVETRMSANETQLNTSQIYMAGQFGEIKAKLDALSRP